MVHFLTKDICFQTFTNMQQAIIAIDTEYIVRYINPAYEKQFAVKADRLIGRDIREVGDESARIVKSMETGKIYTEEIEYVESLNMDTIGVSFPLYQDGKIIGAIASFEDVSRFVALASELHHSKEMNRYLMEQLAGSSLEDEKTRNFVTIDPNMKYIVGMMLKVAKKDVTVLLRGESGTGKEVAARLIHDTSSRAKGPYVKVNCAAIPDNLLESELFGYVGGAFTGAKKEGKAGKFELAQNGTIFLDEIGDMDMNMQVKLLRVLQERELERVGGSKVIKLNIRVIAATNRNLEELIKEGKFRQDLYYRLNVIEVKIPPLRERPTDIPILTKHFIAKMVGKDVRISPKTVKILNNYDWPGNVRELQNVLEHACIMRSSENVIETDALPAYLRPKREEEVELVQNLSSLNLKDMVSKLEKELIEEAIKRYPNKTKAIDELGISRRSFYEKIKKYGIDAGEDE